MKIINVGALAVSVVLSLLAGIAKIMQLPQEVDFFQSAGLGLVPLMMLGGAQIIGAALLMPIKLRAVGASIAGICFLMSAIIIFLTGQVGFAAVSLVPVALTVLVFYTARQHSSSVT